MFDIFPIAALRDNYIWCIQEDSHCIIVDPGDSRSVIKALNERKLDLAAILVTHHHYDHTQGIPELLGLNNNLPVIGPSSIKYVNQPVSANEPFLIPELNLNFKVELIPGHTKEHVAYLTQNIIFTGDTLFTAGCGRIFEGTVQQMYSSLQKIQALPAETLIYCGHEYTESNLDFALAVEPSNLEIIKRMEHTKKLRSENIPTVPATLALERKTNPFLRCDQPEVIRSASNFAAAKLKDSLEVFRVLREWKNTGHF
jgi:hydroxyacylglutathione hydrolase